MEETANSTQGAGELAYHGGNLDAARRRFPGAPEPWIDLSTGINPHAFAFAPPPPDSWANLPSPAALAGLEAAAAKAYGARPPAEVVAGPGTQAMIQWLPRLLSGRRAGVLGFAYAGHERAWRAAEWTLAQVDNAASLADFDAAIVVNPNNPDGRLVSRETLLALAERLSKAHGTLVVDEAFMDVVRPDASLAPMVGRSRVVVLRSFGKAFGLAGLRLGFAIASSEIAAPLRAAIGPWPVSGPAITIGRQALADRRWLDDLIPRLEDEARRLEALLIERGFTSIGGTPLYRLVEHPHAAEMFERLGRAGILARPFAERPGWLRFGIPADEHAWRRLDGALGARR